MLGQHLKTDCKRRKERIKQIKKELGGSGFMLIK
jgi:hypothetical protein